MYYVIQIKFIFLIFSFIWTKYEKDNANQRKKKYYWNVLKCKIYINFLQFNFFWIFFIILVCRFLEIFQNEA